MAIRRFRDYDSVKPYGEGIEMLPRGGYVCTIMGAKPEENRFGQSIRIAFDISEGDYAGYFKRKYDANPREDKKWPAVYRLNVPKDDGSEKDGWTKRRFKTFIEALEASNDGYHFDWDENQFKGKQVGIVFNYRQWEFNGQVGLTPNAVNAVSAESIRQGRFKIPDDKLLPAANDKPSSIPAGFTPIEGTDDDLPF